ncbi:MAG: CBS domain-containing protein [Candidatus Bathyarchaeota archaeon]|nr:MAG: CBS domain-containing protein [Candidatus Bathyarchaeota archaeon]
MRQMRVSEVMVKEPTVVRLDTSVKKVAELMRERSIGSVIIVEGERPVGIITERDLVHRVLALGRDPASLRAKDVCSMPVVAFSEMGYVEDACDTMKEYGVRRLVVVDGRDRVAGILTTDDLVYNLRSMSEELAVKFLIARRRS